MYNGETVGLDRLFVLRVSTLALSVVTSVFFFQKVNYDPLFLAVQHIKIVYSFFFSDRQSLTVCVLKRIIVCVYWLLAFLGVRLLDC